MDNLKDPQSRLAKWRFDLQGYDFSVKHQPGKDHQNADSMSRPPIALAEINALCVQNEQQFDPFITVAKKLLLKQDTTNENEEMVILAKRHTSKMKIVKGMLVRSYTSPATKMEYRFAYA